MANQRRLLSRREERRRGEPAVEHASVGGTWGRQGAMSMDEQDGESTVAAAAMGRN
jgi:hypothetical protein